MESEKYKEGKSVIEKFFIKKKIVAQYHNLRDEKNNNNLLSNSLYHNTSQISNSTAGISARSNNSLVRANT